jgi:DnaK suppressor protein
MDIARHQRHLSEKRDELRSKIARLEDEARTSKLAEVEDPIDQVTSAEAQASALEQVSRATATLHAVEDALARIGNGTYGSCIDCGREIEPARLQAVPWTAYCRADQEKHDRESMPQ